MGLIFYEERKVQAKGLNPDNQINKGKLKEFFHEEDYNNLNLLNSVNIPLNKETITLLYPGCGVDIFFPLIYIEKLFPKVKEANFTFIDTDNALGIIKTVLDDVGIHLSEKKNQISFYWKNILINLEFIQGNVFKLDLPVFDIYFERAFRIMRDKIKDYEDKIFSKLNDGGILISDSGFENVPLKKIEVPKELSSYGEMMVGVKAANS